MKKGLLVMLDEPLKERVREVAYKNKISMGKAIRIALTNQLIIKPKMEAQKNNGTGQSI